MALQLTECFRSILRKEENGTYVRESQGDIIEDCTARTETKKGFFKSDLFWLVLKIVFESER